MYILIRTTGSRERKIKAAYFLFLYTLIGSFFIFFSIVILRSLFGTSNLFLLYDMRETLNEDYFRLSVFL
jgi:NADH:ubiquinone oxidoreductase subunit 4 (subunit M)